MTAVVAGLLLAVPALKPLPVRLTDPKASPGARRLWGELRGRYGVRTLSGQQDRGEVADMKAKSGLSPAVLGEDLMDYSPSRVRRGTYPNGATEANIAQAKAGRIVTLCWHWNAPFGLVDRMERDKNGKEVNNLWYRGFYTAATTFDVSRAMRDPRSPERAAILTDIDAIAVQLKKYARADVAVLFRPLHEAEGGWFWWGAKGPEPCLWLWRTLHDRLTKTYGLHNLIWVWNSVRPEWYPGDATVDVVGVDAYPRDRAATLKSDWDALLARFDGKKMLALTEFGGVPDVDRMWDAGVRWSYFVSWGGDLGPKGTPPETLRRIYGSARVENLATKK